MLVLALGRYVGLAGLLVHLPVIGAMRAPARYVVLMQFALAILAVIAVEDLLAIREGRRELPTGRPVLPWVPTAARRGHARGPERGTAAVSGGTRRRPSPAPRRGSRSSPPSRCW